MSRISLRVYKRDGVLTQAPPMALPLSSAPPFLPPYISNYQKEPIPPSTSANRISPAVLFVIVILAVIFFISGLLHLLVRFLIKQPSSSSSSHSNRYPELSGADALQRQLQQLFHLHDSGLDQAFIDALPVFLYKEIMGLKEPFDCAVCLCEFSETDDLRLLPMCSHAFHIKCIDTWLLSNSTCPLCRGTLFTPGLPIENPVFDFDDPRDEDVLHGDCENGVSTGEKQVAVEEIVAEKRVYPVRLGKYRNINSGSVEREPETSSSNLDARRCYSLGSYEYVEGETNLQVALSHDRDISGDLKSFKRGGVELGQNNGNSLVDGNVEGKKLSSASKGDSFSVSKIWLWSKKGKFQNSLNPHLSISSSLNGSVPCTSRTQDL
ncbi:hypothetical protein GIB67_003450 [Kingdonia uniflora]|uniref:RING-type E3 ubiquitin transferase n=1 Tax=Kingdonia uniflora TaxID=39325 RepID=A0A7J7P9J6_9MAGN|nr:hypothetical protein GIB67_003450 [Kingdonia uniflora]